jgi:hypothetical protein
MSADAEATKNTWSVAGGTTDATPYSFLTIPMNNTASAFAEIFVMARRWDTTETKVWVKNALVKRNGASSALSGAFTDLVTPRGDLGAATWDLTVSMNSGMTIICTGQLGASIFWVINVTIRAIESK